MHVLYYSWSKSTSFKKYRFATFFGNWNYVNLKIDLISNVWNGTHIFSEVSSLVTWLCHKMTPRRRYFQQRYTIKIGWIEISRALSFFNGLLPHHFIKLELRNTFLKKSIIPQSLALLGNFLKKIVVNDIMRDNFQKSFQVK